MIAAILSLIMLGVILWVAIPMIIDNNTEMEYLHGLYRDNVKFASEETLQKHTKHWQRFIRKEAKKELQRRKEKK